MVESSTFVNLPQLVDISLNCQEGLVNFHTLHSLLQVMIIQTGLADVTVEFRGPDSEKVQAIIRGAAKSEKTEQSYMEYTIKGGGKKRRSSNTNKQIKTVSLQDIKEIAKVEEKKEKELRVIERRKDSKEEPALIPIPLKSPPGSSVGLKGESTVVLVESESKLPQFSVAVSKATFEDLQDELIVLKEKVKELVDLPANLKLIQATKEGSSPILDMFQILTLTKRVDAAEIAVEKLGSLLEDILKTPAGDTTSPDLADKIKDIRETTRASIDPSIRAPLVGNDDILQRLTNLEQIIEEIKAGGTDGVFFKSPEATDDAAEAQSVRPSVASASSKPDPRRSTFASVIEGVNLNELPPEEAFDLIQKEFTSIKKFIDSFSPPDGEKRKDTKIDLDDVNLGALENKFTETTKQIDDLDKVYTQQIGLLTDQLNILQKEMSEVLTKVDVILPGGDSTGITAETTMELANKLVFLEKEIMTINETAERLQAEKAERDKNIETIMEQIDVLKIVKANREDLEDALGDKADACQINRKVSHDQFDAACDDLSRGIEEALNKLQEQEEMWNQALDAIQKDVGNKLDRMEVDPLRDFVNSKLKALQEKFKSLTALKREQEAAGTKSKVLRDVNCISCDKDVVMRKEMDPTLKPRPYALPPNRSMAPYLAYELDQLRKQQKCVPGSKNLNFFETAVKTRSSKNKDHVCNRYCGGSHTVTTPQQRVTRLGHFLEQWGPEIAPLNDEYIRGSDNHMYKASDTSHAKKSVQAENASLTVRPSIKSGKEEPASRDEVPQQDRNTYVNPSAQDVLDKDAEARASQNRKVHSIGAAGRYSEGEGLAMAESAEITHSKESLSKPNVEPQRSSEIIIEERPSKSEPRGSHDRKYSGIMEKRSSALKTSESKHSETKRIGFQQ